MATEGRAAASAQWWLCCGVLCMPGSAMNPCVSTDVCGANNEAHVCGGVAGSVHMHGVAVGVL
jgi:hypothetical protein